MGKRPSWGCASPRGSGWFKVIGERRSSSPRALERAFEVVSRGTGAGEEDGGRPTTSCAGDGGSRGSPAAALPHLPTTVPGGGLATAAVGEPEEEQEEGWPRSEHQARLLMMSELTRSAPTLPPALLSSSLGDDEDAPPGGNEQQQPVVCVSMSEEFLELEARCDALALELETAVRERCRAEHLRLAAVRGQERAKERTETLQADLSDARKGRMDMVGKLARATKAHMLERERCRELSRSLEQTRRDKEAAVCAVRLVRAAWDVGLARAAEARDGGATRAGGAVQQNGAGCQGGGLEQQRCSELSPSSSLGDGSPSWGSAVPRAQQWWWRSLTGGGSERKKRLGSGERQLLLAREGGGAEAYSGRSPLAGSNILSSNVSVTDDGSYISSHLFEEGSLLGGARHHGGGRCSADATCGVAEEEDEEEAEG